MYTFSKLNPTHMPSFGNNLSKYVLRESISLFLIYVRRYEALQLLVTICLSLGNRRRGTRYLIRDMR